MDQELLSKIIKKISEQQSFSFKEIKGKLCLIVYNHVGYNLGDISKLDFLAMIENKVNFSQVTHSTFLNHSFIDYVKYDKKNESLSYKVHANKSEFHLTLKAVPDENHLLNMLQNNFLLFSENSYYFVNTKNILSYKVVENSNVKINGEASTHTEIYFKSTNSSVLTYSHNQHKMSFEECLNRFFKSKLILKEL